MSFVALALLLLLAFLLPMRSRLGWLRLSKEVLELEFRGEIGTREMSWRGRRWPWKKISSAGDKSMAKEGGDLHLSGDFAVVGWREMVKENS